MNAENANAAEFGVCEKCGRRSATVAITTCPECGGAIVASPQRRLSWLSVPPMRYPSRYVWLIFLASLDIMMTWVVLHFGGAEENAFAAAVIEHKGLLGVVVFKFALVMFVIVMCEIVGRRRDKTGKRLAECGIAVTAIPVILAFLLLLS